MKQVVNFIFIEKYSILKSKVIDKYSAAVGRAVFIHIKQFCATSFLRF